MRDVRLIALIAAAAAGLGAATPARGQDALGRGDALDANPQVGTAGRNVRVAPQSFSSRNRLITREVAAGRGFRGTVGYTATEDFRGVLGSDDLFDFRADSALSAPSLLTTGRTIERLRFGQSLNAIGVSRAGRGATLDDVQRQRRRPSDELIDGRLELDELALAGTTPLMAERAAEARLVGLVQSQEGDRLAASASVLSGLQFAPTSQFGQALGLSTYDLARLRSDTRSDVPTPQVGAPFERSFTDLRESARAEAERVQAQIEPDAVAARVEPRPAESYRDILDRVAERYAQLEPDAEQPRLLAGLDEQFEALRRQLAGMEAEAEQETADDEAAAADDEETPPLERLVPLLQHKKYLERLSEGQTGRFNELVQSAEQALADGEYFWAERRFTRALRFTPGHPYATAGLGHARIGAGLYAPAALTLTRLLVEHPEMIDVKYGPAVLPSRARLTQAVQRLLELIDRHERDRALHGFLLAYIGHQLDRRPLIEEGLSHVEAGPLRTLLRDVWLAEGEEAAPEK